VQKRGFPTLTWEFVRPALRTILPLATLAPSPRFDCVERIELGLRARVAAPPLISCVQAGQTVSTQTLVHQRDDFVQRVALEPSLVSDTSNQAVDPLDLLGAPE
jgi:hypothetical protein